MASKEDLLRADIRMLRAQLDDSLAMGDSMYGSYAHADVAKEIDRRLQTMLQQKKELEEELKRKDGIVQRMNQDFTDVRDALPETIEHQKVRFIEDYTMMILWLSYAFMVLAAIALYVTVSEEKLPALGKGLGVSGGITLLVGILSYYLI